jgi:hypothetical protein
MAKALDPDRMEYALRSILAWAEAYPLAVFPEPDLHKAEEALEAAGISMGALHGTWGRHLLNGMARYARQGLGK